MNSKAIPDIQSQITTIYRSNLPKFRIRSSSKEKCLSTNKKQKESSFDESGDSNKTKKDNAFEKFKISHQQLKKIFIHRRHQRQRSSDIQNSAARFMQTLEHPQLNNNFLISEVFPFGRSQKKQKLVFQSVRTQESQLHNKPWIDINSIDTTEDIKILDRITTLYDPFRIINQCNEKKNTEKKSQEPRFKSLSARKSKLTQKINNFVFQMASKSKQKSGLDLHRKRFQPLSSRNISNKKSQQQFGDPENHKNSFRKQISSPKLIQRKNSSPQKLQKKSELSNKAIQKSLPVHRYSKNLLLPTSQNKKKIKINVNQMKQNKKNDTMDKFWSGVNQSLILASQQVYISKDLDELLYNNMC